MGMLLYLCDEDLDDGVIDRYHRHIGGELAPCRMFAEKFEKRLAERAIAIMCMPDDVEMVALTLLNTG